MSEIPQAARVLMFGLAEQGKTTYLAALWHVLNQEERPTLLRLSSLLGNRQYVNQIHDSWVKCDQVGRTELEVDRETVLELSDGRGICRLTIPDQSGERLTNYWVDREWPHAFDDRVREARGLLVFVHPEKLDMGATIVEATKIATAIGASQGGGETTAGTTRRFDPSRSPTATQMVDLLQMALLRRSGAPLSIAVVVSAWDRVKEPTSPTDWLERRVPLLAQFLDDAPVNSIVFGVSAQGGELPGMKAELAANPLPADRISIHGSGGAKHDLTWPIAWLLGWEA